MTWPTDDQTRYVEAVAVYVATHLARADHSSSGEGSSWFRTGAPSDELNGVLRLGGDLPAEVDKMTRLFDGVPSSWHFWRGVDRPEVPDLLGRQGLRLFETEPLMVLADVDQSAHFELDRRALARISEVTDVTGLAEWAALWSATGDTASLVAGLRQALELETTRYLVWREGGETLGCAAVVTCEAGAAVEHVVTRADHRGQGIGTALTKRATAMALGAGAERVVLTASPDGERIYQRLGFTTVGYVDRYA